MLFLYAVGLYKRGASVVIFKNFTVLDDASFGGICLNSGSYFHAYTGPLLSLLGAWWELVGLFFLRDFLLFFESGAFNSEDLCER